MITHAFQHIRGIGPARLAKLHEAGVQSWADVLDFPDRIPPNWRVELTEESRRCLSALESGDIHFFVDRFAPRDKWRILAHFLDEATFFDIETLGLEYDAPITVIVCWHRGRYRTFVEHENLDEFLDLLDEVKLLESFNGNSFDVPRVLDSFHIPKLPCPHLDLRWPCYHQGHTGGLKEITSRIGIRRPADLQDADGELAVRLWQAWRTNNDHAAREHLIRYCASDVALLVALAYRVAGRDDLPVDELWNSLPVVSSSVNVGDDSNVRDRVLGAMFGTASPTQLRARHPRLVGLREVG